MFSIHGITGQTFRGTLEHLIQVPGVMPSRHARGINREGEEIGVQVPESGRRQAAAAPGQEQAIAAYRQTLPRELERGPLYHAWQVMHTPVISARGDAPVEQVWRLLVEHGIRQVPILDPARRLLGLVNDRDLLTVLNVEHDQVRDVLARTAADVMRSPVVAAEPITDIRRIARVMLDYGQSGVPILDERESLIGFVSRGDILRAATLDPPLSLWV
ncbi:MAG: CBS domain-containing protein [Pseudomonadota bacterium]|nr:CBS domain-containing protein [Pseudomonadota bacterium]